MPRKIRVLIVDDAVVVRKMVSDLLQTDPEIEVCGIAANGKIALSKLTQVNPDVITLDIEMPEMDGLETLREIRKTHPRLPVIMFSTLTERGATATLDALSFGASDYVTKPANVGSVQVALQRIREQLIPKIKALHSGQGHKSLLGAKARTMPVAGAMAPPRPSSAPPEVLVIGVSTGGPNALSTLLPDIPGDFPLPILIVQHMPPLFTKLLADRLDGLCPLTVCEAEAGMVIEAGGMWIAPGDYHMTLKRKGAQVVIETNQEPAENSCRPAVDVLFRSVADAYHNRVLGLILTGMGQDGLRGCESIREAGGSIFVQDEETSVVWGMPGFVAEAGLAEKLLPLDRIAVEITRRAAQGRALVRRKVA